MEVAQALSGYQKVMETLQTSSEAMEVAQALLEPFERFSGLLEILQFFLIGPNFTARSSGLIFSYLKRGTEIRLCLLLSPGLDWLCTEGGQ